MTGAPDHPDLTSLADLIGVMDRLRSPGGCPWDAEQTHHTLAPYAVEESYELVDAIAGGDRGELREELGDLLLQVVFHARVAQDDPQDPFDLDDVARGIAAKLRRRHPHVFADGDARTAEAVAARWDEIKAVEKPERHGLFDGIPQGMPGLERAAKMTSRLARAGQSDVAVQIATGDTIGARLFALVVESHERGLDPSVELATVLRDLAREVESTD
ncbi:hypothetical protein KEM60_01832 [Austwickia sp. TVS 96-490-7B]|uniref:MazG family protein n=1 Tax=Austwickia sp. TVS 96-490-7B TaxID=2830843 RepID=UPI001DA68652|nr:MazG family protein [Austwickia sp. TVS 96-490-7B]MBW3085629.1 hypothetical protein [Austwickia sp. TVS 96-490-7B]